MKATLKKDKKGRQSFVRSEEKLCCIKALKKKTSLGCALWARQKLASFPSQSYKNRCLLTFRGPSIKRDFKMSRLEFRRWALASMLPGVQKGSW